MAKELPLLAVDAPSLLYRAFYALPDSITGADGKPVNALLGAANLILRELDEHPARAVVLCFGQEAADYRVELFGGYHADRPEMPEALVPQWAACPEFFGAFGWHVDRHPTLEADDLLGTYAKLEEAAGGTALLLTGDRDMYQCATEAVSVLYVKTGGGRGAEVVTPAEVERRYGIAPALVPDFIALRGDPSDGIPGARGVGEKTAAELLREHGSLEGLLESAVRITKPRLRSTLIDSAAALRDYKDMATLRDAGVKRPRTRKTTWAKAATAAEAQGMNALARRLRERA